LLGGDDTTEGFFRILNGVTPSIAINAATDDLTGITLVVDTPYKLEFVRTTTTITVTATKLSDSTTQVDTATVDAANMVLRYVGSYNTTTARYEGNIWDITSSDTTSGVLFQNYLSQGADDTTAYSVIGPDVTLVGFVAVDGSFYTESALYGSIWQNSLGYNIGSEIPEVADGYIPASLTTPTQDIFGNTLTYRGKAAQNLDVFGYTIDWDGAAHGDLDELITWSGDGAVEFPISYTTGVDQTVIGGENTTEGFIYLRSIATVRFYIGGSAYDFSQTLSDGVTYLVKIVRTGSNLELFLDGVSQQVISSVSTADIIFRYLATWVGGNDPLRNVVPYIKLYDSTDTLINHWPIEGRNGNEATGDTQTTFYDVVGGNDVTVVSGTTPLFTKQMQPSYLAKDGGRVVENGVGNSNPTIGWTFSANANEVNIADGWRVDIIDSNIAYPGSGGATTYTNGTTVYIRTKLRAITGESGTVRIGNAQGNTTFTGTEDYISIDDSLREYTLEGTMNADGVVRPAIRNGGTLTQVVFADSMVTSDENAQYIETTGTAIPLSVIPYGGTDQPNTFNGVWDAPEDLLTVNAPETVEIYNADSDYVLLDESTGVAKDVDPYDLAISFSDQFKRSSTGMVGTDGEQTGTCALQTDTWLGLVDYITFGGEPVTFDFTKLYMLRE
jgi:hypothetical protein